MKILVTGGAGFIGSHIVDAYLKKGHEVHIVDDMSTGRRENINPGAVFHEMNVADEAISELIARERFALINHHAAQLDVRKSVSDPAFDANVNIIGSIRLLQAGIENGLERFIFASSGGTVYGEQEFFPADESHPNKPISPYGIAKLTVEKYLYFYHVQYGLNYTALRYANVYGPRQNPHGEAGVVAIFAERMLAGEPITIHGDGLQTRDYVHVSDVVQANVLALDAEKPDAYNIGMGVETSVVDLFNFLNISTGAGYERNHGPGKPGEQRRSVLDAGKIRRELGWNPSFDVEMGMQDTVEWFKTRNNG